MLTIRRALLSLLASAALYAAAPQCDEGERAISVGARYVQGSGIGYERGYTTVEGFLALPRCQGTWNPYIDLRGHVFNNGRMAANAGIGARRIGTVSLGANAYYDYRRTSRYHYNQVGVGLEAIGPFWSVSVNGYYPVGRRKTPFFEPSVTGTANVPNFAFFQGNTIFITLSGTQSLKAWQEFAFPGVDANAAFRVVKKNLLVIDVEAGPYYFAGRYRKYAVGGKGMVSFRVADILSLSLIASYDNLFHSRVQGMAGFSIPIGPRSFGKHCEKKTCSIPSFSNMRLARGAERTEIVVVDRHKKVLASAAEGQTTVAIDPLTGLPYLVWFVDNTSSSDGTYESPFNTLADAQTAAGPNQLIYVYPGDGTDMGMNAGIALQDGQMLIGSSVPFTLETTYGPIVIPAESATAPLITNMGGTAVTLANQNAVLGVHLATNDTGISGMTIADLRVLSCTIESTNNPIFLNEFTGDATIQSNTLSDYTVNGLSVSFTSGSNSLTVASNTIEALAAAPNTFGIQLSLGGAASTLSVTENTLLNNTNTGMNAALDGAIACSMTVSGNTLQADPGVTNKGIALATTGASNSVWNAVVSNNTVAGGFTQADIYLNAKSTSSLTATVSGNTALGDSSTSTIGIQIDTDDTAAVSSAVVSNNICQNHTASEMAFSSRGAGTTAAMTISNNQLTGQLMSGSGDGIQLSTNNGGVFTVTVSGNTISNVHNTGVNLFSNNTSSLNATLSSNSITAPAAIANTTAISVGTNDSASITYMLSDNTLLNHTGLSIASHFDGTGTGSAAISGNTVVGIAGTSGKGVSLDTGGASSVSWQTSIQNNTFSGGFTQADIYLDPQGTSMLTSAVISGNTTSGDPGGTSPYGIQLDADGSTVVTSLQITNNMSTNHTTGEIAINARGSPGAAITTTISGNQLSSSQMTGTGIQVDSNNAGVINATIASNTCTGHPNTGISSNANNSSLFTSSITNNTITAPLGTSGSNGISVNTSDTVALDLSILDNTVAQCEGFSIQVNYGGTSFDCLIDGNQVTHGTVFGNAFGIITVLGGSMQNVTISNNTVTTPAGGIGSQFGIVCVEAASSMPVATHTATVIGNTAINCGNAPPAFGFTTGIGMALQNADNFFADMESNMMTNCASGSLGGGVGLRINAFGPTPGHMCWKLVNNTSNTDYSLLNDPPTGMASDFTLDASGNIGTVVPVGGSPFTPGTCP